MRGAVFVVAAWLLACGGGRAPASQPPPNRAPEAPAAPTAASSQPAADDAERVIAEALDYVAELRKLAPKTKVRGVVISREELLERVERDLLVDLEPEMIEGTTELLFALNLTPAKFDLVESLLTLYGTQLAGFYDPQAKEMVLLDDLEVGAQEATLWHELVHALQDQNYDLQKLIQWRPDRGDAVTAVQALAEGDAMSAMLDAMLLPRGQRALDVPEAMISKSLAAVEALPEVASVPSILKRSIVAPYTDGLAFAHAMRRDGDWAAVDSAWLSPPETTEQLLHPDKYRAREPALSIPVPPPPLAGPRSVRYRDVLGEQSIRLLFEEWVPLDTAREAAAGWGGDRVAVFVEGNRRAVAVAVRYDDEAGAARALEVVARGALAPPLEEAPGVRSQRSPEAVKAAAAGRICRERRARGPFAAVRNGRDLAVTLGPYTRDRTDTGSAADCAAALDWASRVAKQR